MDPHDFEMTHVGMYMLTTAVDRFCLKQQEEKATEGGVEVLLVSWDFYCDTSGFHLQTQQLTVNVT